MEQFNKYSQFYDTFYINKPYLKEVKFIEQALKKYSKNHVKTLLSLGCGTGTYEQLLAKKERKIVGIDLSESMIAKAKKKIGVNNNIILKRADIRNYRDTKKYDAVIAMFNIIGYMKTSADLDKFLATAATHLKRKGLLIFDGWYQPAILTDRPFNLVKKIKLGEQHQVYRQTVQTLDIEKSLLNITFKIVEKKKGRIITKLTEKHPMRFFTLNELKFALLKNNLELAHSCVFPLLKKPVSEKYWDLAIVAHKK